MRAAALLLLVVSLACASVPVHDRPGLPSWTELSTWTPAQIAADPEGALEAARRDELRCLERLRQDALALGQVRQILQQLQALSLRRDTGPRAAIPMTSEDTCLTY